MGRIHKAFVLSDGKPASAMYCMSQEEISRGKGCKMQVDGEQFADDVPNEEARFYFLLKDLEEMMHDGNTKKLANELQKTLAMDLMDHLNRRFCRV